MDKALDLPEIIFRVGWFLPLWGRSKDSQREYDFEPANLISCIQVSHTWRMTLTPLLWMVYEENANKQWRIPIIRLQAQSHHFRHLKLLNTYHRGYFTSTRLRTLSIHGYAAGSTLELLYLNPQLSSLNLNLCGLQFSAVYPALSAISRLEDLELGHVKFDTPHQLPDFLSNNPYLSKLRLVKVISEARLDGCEQLTKVSRLFFSFNWLQNFALTPLIRFCPNLESLVFLSNSHCPFDEITRNLQECCPKLQSMSCIEVHQVRQIDMVEDKKIIALLHASSRLLSIEITRRVFTSTVCQAVLDHAGWLESVELKFLEADEENVRNMNRILASCPNLRTLRAHGGFHACYDDLSLESFELAWNCPHLESIDLEGFTLFGYGLNICSESDSAGGSTQTISQHLDVTLTESQRLGLPDPWYYMTPLPFRHSEADRQFLDTIARKGWTVEARSTMWSDPYPMLKATRAIRNLVFDRVQDYPYIHTVAVEGLLYVNKGRMPRGCARF